MVRGPLGRGCAWECPTGSLIWGPCLSCSRAMVWLEEAGEESNPRDSSWTLHPELCGAGVSSCSRPLNSGAQSCSGSASLHSLAEGDHVQGPCGHGLGSTNFSQGSQNSVCLQEEVTVLTAALSTPCFCLCPYLCNTDKNQRRATPKQAVLELQEMSGN